MENRVNYFITLLEKSKVPDQAVLDSATAELQQLSQAEDYYQILIATIQNFPQHLNATLVYLLKYIKANLLNFPDQIYEEVLNFFHNLAKSNVNDEYKSQISECIYTLQNRNQDWTSYVQFALTCDPVMAIMLIFSGCTSIDESLIEENAATFLQIAFTVFQGFQFQYFEAIAAILIACTDTQAFIDAAQNIVQIVDFGFQNYDSLKDSQIYSICTVFSQLFVNKIVDDAQFSNYLHIVMQHAEEDPATALFAANNFEDCVQLLSDENLLEILVFCLTANVKVIESEGNIPEDGTDIIKSALEKRNIGQVIYQKVGEFMNEEDIAPKMLALRLISDVLLFAPDAVSNEGEYIKTLFSEACTCDITSIKQTALTSLASLENAPTKLRPVIIGIILATLNCIVDSDDTTRILAYSSLNKLLDTLDDEISGLFDEVWSILENIPPSDITSYISLVSSIILHSSDIDDDRMDAIYTWLDDISNEERELDVRAASLEVIGAIMVAQNSFIDDLVELAQGIISLCFEENNEQLLNEVFHTLKLVISTFKGEAVSFIEPFVENINQILVNPVTGDEETGCFLHALITAAFYIGYSGNRSLLQITVSQIIRFLNNQALLTEENTFLAAGSVVKIFVPSENEEENQFFKENIISIYDLMVKSIIKNQEFECLDTGFKCLKSVYKYGVVFEREHFMTSAVDLISKFFSGELTIFDGVPAKQSPCTEFIAESFCVFVGKVFECNLPQANEISNFMLEWLNEAQSVGVMYPITGALSDAIEFCELDPSIPTNLSMFVINHADEIDDPDLQHNISYFLGLIVRRFPELNEVVARMMPYVERWFANAVEKESGYAEMIANIVSFYLSYAAVDPSFPEINLQRCLKYFPPADLAETETQIQQILVIFQRQFSQDTMASCAMALSKYFVEAPQKVSKRKVAPEIVEQAKNLFKALCGSSEVNQFVFRQYANQRQKRAILQAIIQ